MPEKEKVVPAPPSEKRRKQFAPHESPKRQPDGDPGPNSTRESPNPQQRGAERQETARDDAAEV